MRADLINRLSKLENHSPPETLTYFLHGYLDDGQTGLLCAGWYQDGECNLWELGSGMEPPPELVVLVEKSTASKRLPQAS
jgi:hypothetical protein